MLCGLRPRWRLGHLRTTPSCASHLWGFILPTCRWMCESASWLAFTSSPQVEKACAPEARCWCMDLCASAWPQSSQLRHASPSILSEVLGSASKLRRSPFIRSFNRAKEDLSKWETRGSVQDQQVSERRNAWGELHSDQLAATKAYEKWLATDGLFRCVLRYHEQRRQGRREDAYSICDRFGLSSSTLDDVVA